MPEKQVKVSCRGRGFQQEPVLQEPVSVSVSLVRLEDSANVGVAPSNCPYLTGGHGQRCKAAHPEKDKVGDGIGCPFSFDFPYASLNKHWTAPPELKEALRAISAD